MARVSHEPGIPAAVHAAGGAQHVGVKGARLVKTNDATGDAAAPRSTIQNSEGVVPAEL